MPFLFRKTQGEVEWKIEFINEGNHGRNFEPFK